MVRRSSDEKIIKGAVLASIVFAIIYPMFIGYYFTTGCVLKYSRWDDMGVCWNEQKGVAKKKAANIAANFW